jgi:hypothetical protein
MPHLFTTMLLITSANQRPVHRAEATLPVRSVRVVLLWQPVTGRVPTRLQTRFPVRQSSAQLEDPVWKVQCAGHGLCAGNAWLQPATELVQSWLAGARSNPLAGRTPTRYAHRLTAISPAKRLLLSVFYCCLIVTKTHLAICPTGIAMSSGFRHLRWAVWSGTSGRILPNLDCVQHLQWSAGLHWKQDASSPLVCGSIERTPQMSWPEMHWVHLYNAGTQRIARDMVVNNAGS